MLNLGSSKFQASAIFLQPTYTCNKNCFGCYVKEQEIFFKAQEISTDLWHEVIREALVLRNHIQTNQITLALDTLPRNISSPAYKKMLNIGQFYLLQSALAIYNPEHPEIHLTVNCISDLREYYNSVSNLYICDGITLLSISNINKIEDVLEARKMFPAAKINWNILSTNFIKLEPSLIKEILTHVDNCYLLLHKAPTGNKGHEIATFIKAVSMLEQFKDKTPAIEGACKVPDITSKIVMDHCMTDAVKYSKTGFGCSANVSRFQIWPDGRVTGCAYNSQHQYGKAANSLQDIVDNLRDARNRYEFDICTIPSELKLYQISK